VRRRIVSLGSILVAVVALGLVLYNATIVDRRPPSVTGITLSATEGSDPAVAQTVTAIDIEFSEPVRTGSVERRFKIDPFWPGTISWQQGSRAIFTPSTKLPQATRFTVTIAPGFEDLAGNAATTGLDAWGFTTVGPPNVTAVQPADGSDRIAVDSGLTITFNRLMETEAVVSAIRIQPAAAFHPTWSGVTLTLGFDQPLLFGTTYTVTIDASAIDGAGNHLERPYTMRFTTVAATLGVLGTIPVNGVAGVSVRGPIALTFDGAIDPQSATNALQITPAVQGSVEVSSAPTDASPVGGPSPSATTGGGSMLVFQPSAPLAPHTTYTVTLRSVVTPLGSPGQVAQGKSWSFTTGQPATSGQNQIAFLSARSGVRNVWLMNPDGSNPRQLTDELAPVAGFDVTGDGSRVVWSAGGAVKVMRIDGTGLDTLTAAGTLEYAPKFAPDGRSILVGRRDADGTDLGYWLVPLGGGDPRQVLGAEAPPIGSSLLGGDGVSTGEGAPVWAPRAAFDPGARRLAVTTGSGSVWFIDLVTPSSAQAADDTGLVALDGPVWSQTANRFFVVGHKPTEPNDGLWSISLGGVTTRLTDADGSVAMAADGSIAFLVRDSLAATHVAVGRYSAPEAAHTVTNDVNLRDRWPAFSPDGQTVLFARVPVADDDVSAGIWTVEIGSGRLSALTTTGAFPRWLP
jgi:hypothetical protein